MDFNDLLKALNFENDRQLLLQIEEELIIFKTKSRDGVLQLPSMTAHHRWLAHCTAERFGFKSNSTGWGYDKATRIQAIGDTKEPILKYVDFFPQNEDHPLDNRDNKLHTAWIYYWKNLLHQQELKEKKEEEERKERIEKKKALQSSPSSNTSDNSEMKAEGTSTTDKKRRRPDFSTPYRPLGRRNAEQNTTASSAKSVSSSEKKPENGTSSTRSVKGRGSTNFNRSEEDIDKERDSERKEVEKEMANQKSEEKELPLSPKQTPTISEDQLLTEAEQEMPLVPLAKDYQRYEAEKIRAKEEQKKRFIKSFIELPKGSTSFIFTDAWKFNKQGKGVVEFKTKGKNFSVGFSTSKNSQNIVIEVLFQWSEDSKYYQARIREKHSNANLASGELIPITSLDLYSFWIKIHKQEVSIGSGNFPENYAIRYKHKSEIISRYIGFAGDGNSCVIKSISIRKGVTSLFASRLHILELSFKSESIEWSETMIKEVLGQFVHKTLIVDGKAIVVMNSISAAFSCLESCKENCKVTVALLEESSSRWLADFQPAPERPSTDPRIAKRFLSNALS